MTQAWPKIKLGDILIRADRFEKKEDLVEYRFAGTYSYAKGIFVSGNKIGVSFGLPKIQRIRTDDFVYCKIMAWEGAFGVAPPAANNCVMSGAFVAYEPVREKVLPDFLKYFFTLESNWRKIGQESSGTNVRRQSLHPIQFEKCEIQLPSITEQKKIVAKISDVKQQLQEADKLRSLIDRDIASLLAVRFQETLTQAKWLPMREVAPLVRREIAIDAQTTYLELGVRSFFKGAFIRRTVSGEEFTWQKLYQVKAGDLIFSNIMAWERAIALARIEHNSCVGNHRMLTCETKPAIAHAAYLHYYFTTEEGFAKIYAASPGTAARNRTMTADSLMAIEVPVPTLAMQKQFVKLKSALERSTAVRDEQKIRIEALLPSLCHQLLSPPQ
jgi:type I restriction enzyme S subunit